MSLRWVQWASESKLGFTKTTRLKPKAANPLKVG